MGSRERAIQRRAKRARRAARDKERPTLAPAASGGPLEVFGDQDDFDMGHAQLAAQGAEYCRDLQDHLDHIHDDLAAILAHLGITRPDCEPWMPEPDEVSPDES